MKPFEFNTFNIGDFVTNSNGSIQVVPGFYGQIVRPNYYSYSYYKVQVFSYIKMIDGKHSERVLVSQDFTYFQDYEMRLMTEEELNEHNKFMCFQ